jgi:PST family polysaccharide transporter
LARLLTPNDFGLIAMVTAITNFALVFKDIGLSTATIQRAELNHAQVSTLFWINFAFGAVLAVSVAGLAPLVAWFYGEPRLGPVMAILSLSFVFGGLTVQSQALLKRMMRFTALGFAEVFGMLLGVAVAVVSARYGAGYWALVLMHVTIPAGIFIGIWAVCPWRPGWPSRRSGVRPMLAFGRDIAGFQIVNYFSRNLDNILIGKFWGGIALGLYSRAYSLMMLPLSQIRQPLTSVALPALSRLQDEPERYRRAFLGTTEKILMLSLPPVTLLLVGSDWVIAIVLGPQWAGASRIFAWLGVAAITQMALIVSGWLFVSQGRSRDFFLWGLIGSVLSVLSFLIGLPHGAVGVAAAYSLVGVFLRFPILVWWAGRRGTVGSFDLLRSIAPFVMVSVGLGLCGFALRRVIGTSRPVAGLGILGLSFTVLTVVFYTVMPRTRAVAQDLWKLVRAGWGSEAKPVSSQGRCDGTP